MNATTISYEDCKAGFADLPIMANIIDRKMLCTINPERGTCFGDSGKIPIYSASH